MAAPPSGAASVDSGLRGFFDPDTQAFNVSALQMPTPRRQVGTDSRRATPAEVPVGFEAQSNLREGNAPGNVLQLLKGKIAASSRRSSGNPRARSSAAEGAPSEPRASSAMAVPRTVADLPDDLKSLERISAALRQQGYYGVPQIYGTKQAPGSSGYKAYIRNVKAQIIAYTRER